MSDNVKLSETQNGVLLAMQNGVAIRYVSILEQNNGGYFYRVDNWQRVTAASDALINKGLAVTVGQVGSMFLTLTDAGKAWKVSND